MSRILAAPRQIRRFQSYRRRLGLLLSLSCLLLSAACLASCEYPSTNRNTNARPTPSLAVTPTPYFANTNSSRNPTREEYERDAEQYRREARESGRTVGTGTNDGWLWVKARFDLANTEDLRDSNINVDVENAVVSLSGIVSTEAQRNKAGQIVLNIEGIRGVKNNLTIARTGPSPSPPPSPSVSPSPSPSPTFDVDSEIDKLKAGATITEAPTAMELGETRTVVLVLSPDIAAAPAIAQERRESLQRHDRTHSKPLVPKTEIETEQASYASSMEAKLSGQGFDIRAVTPERQAVASKQRTTWTWDVKATSSGEQYLHLSLNAIFEGTDRERVRAVTTYSKTVKVNVSIGTFVKNNWQVIATAIGIPLVIGVLIPFIKWAAPGFWESRVKKKNKDKKSIGFKR